MRRIVALINPGGRRHTLLSNALSSRNTGELAVWSWLSAATAPEQFPFEGPCFVRFDSPGQDSDVQRRLLAAGADGDLPPHAEHLSKNQALELPADRGRIVAPAQWYAGFCTTLRKIENTFRLIGVTQSHSADQIAALFDKRKTHVRCAEKGIPTPTALPNVTSFESLVERMREVQSERVFVKLAHGSSASGVIAVSNQNGWRALTTMEIDRSQKEERFYNNRNLRMYSRTADIAKVVNYVCREGVHVEQWEPKARTRGREFDLRIVTIAQKATHIVARIGRTPITNLHLGNQRQSGEALSSILSEEQLLDCVSVAEATARLFGECMVLGVDVMLTADRKRSLVIEANAFGDLVPDVFDSKGRDTYTAWVDEVLG